MAWLFKAAGLTVLFCACSAYGVLKSYSLKKRKKALTEIIFSMTELRDRIRTGAGELEKIIALSFGDKAVFENGAAKISCDDISLRDRKLINELFSGMGMADAETECGRITLYITLTEKQCAEAEKNCAELCRLYTAFGVLCGAFLCIFFL